MSGTNDGIGRFELPSPFGPIKIEVSGGEVRVRGALRTIVEMPITLEYGKPQFSNFSIDKPTETFIVEVVATNKDELNVKAGMLSKEDDGSMNLSAPYFEVRPGEKDGVPVFITTAHKAFNDRVKEPGRQHRFPVQVITFKKSMSTENSSAA
jgi:hypothetical protein